jgi:hypothetical protein
MNKAFSNVFITREGQIGNLKVCVVFKDGKEPYSFEMPWSVYTAMIAKSNLKHIVRFDKQQEELIDEECDSICTLEQDEEVADDRFSACSPIFVCGTEYQQNYSYFVLTMAGLLKMFELRVQWKDNTDRQLTLIGLKHIQKDKDEEFRTIPLLDTNNRTVGINLVISGGEYHYHN